MRWLRIESALSLRVPLRRGTTPPTDGSFAVRELRGDELAEALRATSGHPIARVDAVAPGRWRAFVARDSGGRPIHHSFVGYRGAGPLLFMCWTAPAARGRGAFTETMRHIIATLGAEGEPHLDSSCSAKNLPSVRGHEHVGFRIVRRRHRLIVAGVDLRGLARRLLR